MKLGASRVLGATSLALIAAMPGCDRAPTTPGGADAAESGSVDAAVVGSDAAPIIPLPRLLSRVEEFRGRKVRAVGFLLMEREDRFLFFHQRDCDALVLENALYVDDVVDEWEVWKFDDMTIRQYVVVEGFVGRGGWSRDHTQFTEVLKIHALEKKHP